MKEYGFGVDIGGTTIKFGLFRTDGTLLEKWEIPTDTSDSGKHILSDIVASVHGKMVEKDLTKEQVQGIGIGVPGSVDRSGVVNRAVNLGWGVVPIEQELSELSGMFVKAANDANVAALGEYWMGSGREYDSIVMVTLGTGIGGGVIIDGKILTGANGAGGEIGHIVVNEQEIEACGCGHYGCIEQYASATGIVRMAKRTLANTAEDTPLKGFGDSLTAKDIFDLAKEGDKTACEIIEDVCGLLGATIAQICCVVDPDAVIIGGGVSKAGQILIDYLQEPFRSHVFHACKDTKLCLASLGNDAGIYGAAGLLL